jgi:glucose-1-phosphate thymidylyltransferase
MVTAGVDPIHVVVRAEKSDLIAALEASLAAVRQSGPVHQQLADAGGMVGFESETTLRSWTTPRTPSPTHSLAVALRSPEVRQQCIALAFPDILFTPRQAFVDVLARLDEMECEAVLGCFPASDPAKTDMVDFTANGSLRALRIKQPDCGWRYTWQIAAWKPRFTERLLHEVEQWDRAAGQAAPPGPGSRSAESKAEKMELHVGLVLQRALDDGAKIFCVPFPDGTCLDIGTPDDLARVRGRADHAASP